MFFNHLCMNYLGLSHAPSFLFFSCNIWSSHNIQSFSYIYQYSAKAGNLSQSFILFLLLLLVGIHTPAKSVRTYLVPYGWYALFLLQMAVKDSITSLSNFLNSVLLLLLLAGHVILAFLFESGGCIMCSHVCLSSDVTNSLGLPLTLTGTWMLWSKLMKSWTSSCPVSPFCPKRCVTRWSKLNVSLAKEEEENKIIIAKIIRF